MPFALPVLLVLVGAAATRPPAAALTSALAALREGDFAGAARTLPAAEPALAKNRDYYLYYLGESQFYAGDYGKARATFGELGKTRASRLAAAGPWRVADCLWMDGKRTEAAAAYRKLVGAKGGDPAVARFRIAVVAAEAARNAGARGAAARAYRQIHVDFPAHPLAPEAARQAALLAPATPESSAVEPSPQERLQRAATLSKGRHYLDAIAELERLPAALPGDLPVRRDFALGMAKYRARRDYGGAAQLLLGVAPRLSGDKAAFAAFHGARSLSRADRDDEAIIKYRNVVTRYSASPWAAEAQFRAGWLAINRGQFRAALGDLRETLARYPRSAFADDAAWYVALAHYLLGESAQALTALTAYEKTSRPSNEDAKLRALYWRARILTQAGQADEAQRQLRECAARAPWSYYALLAQARLRERGQPPAALAAPARGAAPAPVRDALLDRVRELERVGLDVEAGIELERIEAALIKRHGRATVVPFLLATYPRLQAFHRAYQLADHRGEPAGDTRLYWEAAYPRAYATAIERHGKESGNPDLFLYAIMRKESTYFPFALSVSDARGLLQLIPTTGAAVAKHLGLPAHADELFEPDTNIRLGAAYLGGLLRRFRGQEALAAGAYNAGARAMMRWCDQWPGRPLDELVELITYDQAREYIKRVLGIYARYRYLYGHPLELSLTVNTDYLKTGFDF